MKLVIMTAKRDPSYLHQTLASVLASDWRGDVVLATDPDDAVALKTLSHHGRVTVDVLDSAE